MRLAGFLIFMCLSGCSIFDSNEHSTWVKIDPILDSYRFSDTTWVSLNMTNRTSSSVFFGGCDKQYIEVLDGRTVEDNFTTVRSCECICIVEINPGETVQFDYSVSSFQQARQDIETNRFYRIWPFFYRSKNFDDELPRQLIDVKSFFLRS